MYTQANTRTSLDPAGGTSFQLMHYFSTLPDAAATNDVIRTQNENKTYEECKTSPRLFDQKLFSTEINKLEPLWSGELPRKKSDLKDFRSELEKLLQFFSLNDLVIL